VNAVNEVLPTVGSVFGAVGIPVPVTFSSMFVGIPVNVEDFDAIACVLPIPMLAELEDAAVIVVDVAFTVLLLENHA